MVIKFSVLEIEFNSGRCILAKRILQRLKTKSAKPTMLVLRSNIIS